jgi:hypothetical protein
MRPFHSDYFVDDNNNKATSLPANLEHIPALGFETGDVRCAWLSLRTSATNVKQHRVLSK